MRIDEELAQYSPDRDCVLTIGVLDGVHRGHYHLISRLTHEASVTGRQSGVVTFRNHPASVLSPTYKSQYLTTLHERISLISNLGVDLVAPVTFDPELSKLPARDFIALLQKHLRMSGLVVGPDFAMGHERDGDVKALTTLGTEIGFTVSVADVLEDKGQPIRSTTIRQALAEGNVTRVAELLGRSFVLRGVVVEGDKRGRTLGFPTANLEVPLEMAVPGNAIYATWAYVDERRYMAATSIGTRPTFGGNERTVEAFLLDFEDDLYGREIRLEFVNRLRAEEKYDTIQKLLEQIDKDVEQTKEMLQAAGTGYG